MAPVNVSLFRFEWGTCIGAPAAAAQNVIKRQPIQEQLSVIVIVLTRDLPMNETNWSGEYEWKRTKSELTVYCVTAKNDDRRTDESKEARRREPPLIIWLPQEQIQQQAFTYILQASSGIKPKT